MVAMVPCTSILPGYPAIGETITRSDGTLSHTIDAVHMRSIELPDPMPVNASTITAIGSEPVIDFNRNILS